MKVLQDKQVFDLTGFSVMLSVSSDENPIIADYEFQSNAALNAKEGSLTSLFTTEEADRVGDFYYNVQLTDGTGKISTIRKGKLALRYSKATNSFPVWRVELQTKPIEKILDKIFNTQHQEFNLVTYWKPIQKY